MKRTALQAKEKLYNQILKTQNGCWEWQGTRLPKGYGLYRVLGERYAHRISYSLHKGPVLKGMVVMHTCDNPPCVNPDHLVIGTYQSNVDDMMEKGRSKLGRRFKSHCPVGHEYTEESSFVRKDSNGRVCRICKRAKELAKYHADKQ